MSVPFTYASAGLNFFFSSTTYPSRSACHETNLDAVDTVLQRLELVARRNVAHVAQLSFQILRCSHACTACRNRPYAHPTGSLPSRSCRTLFFGAVPDPTGDGFLNGLTELVQ